MKTPERLYTIKLSKDTWRLIDEEARREELQTGGRRSRSRIADRRIRQAYEECNQHATTS